MVKKVSVLVGAGSIGQAIIRRVSAPVEEILRVDHILYDGKEIVTDSLSDYSAEDMFNSPGWEGEIDEI